MLKKGSKALYSCVYIVEKYPLRIIHSHTLNAIRLPHKKQKSIEHKIPATGQDEEWLRATRIEEPSLNWSFVLFAKEMDIWSPVISRS